MSPSTTSRRRNQLARALVDKDFREAFVAETISQGIAFQIKETRDERGWTQAELGERAGKPQPVISQLENPDYGAYTLKTLKALASAFDVALVVRFVPFSELVNYTTHLTPGHLAPVDFGRDAALYVREFPEMVATTPSKARIFHASSQLPLGLSGNSVTAIDTFRDRSETRPSVEHQELSAIGGGYR